MIPVSCDLIGPVILLDPRESQRLLEAACRRSAHLTLALRGLPAEVELEGTLVSGKASTLTLLSSATPVDRLAQWPMTAACDATLLLDGETYLFDTALLALTRVDGDTEVEIVRPPHMSIWQRRQYARTELAIGEGVHIDETSGTTAWNCHGDLINISLEGLACVVDRTDADRLRAGGEFTVRFHLPGESAAFTFVAVLKSKIVTEDANRINLGWSFNIDSKTRAAHDRFRRRLKSLSHGPLEV